MELLTIINIAAKISISRRGYNTFSLRGTMCRGVAMRVVVPVIIGGTKLIVTIPFSPSFFVENNAYRKVF